MMQAVAAHRGGGASHESTATAISLGFITVGAGLAIVVVGIDDTVMQTVHASHNYYAQDILWGARMRDVLSDLPDGSMLLDLRNFHEVDPSTPTADFPYSLGAR